MNSKLSVASWIQNALFLISVIMLVGQIFWFELTSQNVDVGTSALLLLMCLAVNGIGEWIAESTRIIAKIINIAMLSLGGVYTLMVVRYAVGLGNPPLHNMAKLGAICLASAVILLGVGGAIEAHFNRSKSVK